MIRDDERALPELVQVESIHERRALAKPGRHLSWRHVPQSFDERTGAVSRERLDFVGGALEAAPTSA